MKHLIQIIASLILVAIISSSCIFMGSLLKGNGNVVEETRKAGEFNKIKVSRGMNVYISQGDETNIVVKADDNLLDAIETRMEGNTLKITATQNIRRATSKKIFVTTPNIAMIKSTEGSNVFSETVFSCSHTLVKTIVPWNFIIKPVKPTAETRRSVCIWKVETLNMKFWAPVVRISYFIIPAFTIIFENLVFKNGIFRKFSCRHID